MTHPNKHQEAARLGEIIKAHLTTSAWPNHSVFEQHSFVDALVALCQEPQAFGVTKVDRVFKWDGEALAHTPALLVEFSPVPANSPNTTKGWGDRDELADFLERKPAAASPVCTNGWRLVPPEATDEMCEAAWDSEAADYVGEHKRIWQVGLAYRAMLAAAPRQEPQAEVLKAPDCGHGHVYPRADGIKARCGGPALCAFCKIDLAAKSSSASTAPHQEGQASEPCGEAAYDGYGGCETPLPQPQEKSE